MSIDTPSLETQGEGERVSEQEVEQKLLEISDIQKNIDKISQNQDPEIRERLENSGLQDEVLQFISDAAHNTLGESSSEYSANTFDTDGENGLDSFEFENFSDSLSLAIEQIVILDGIGAFNEIQEDSAYSGWYAPDKKIAEYADFQEIFLGDDQGSSFSEEALNALGVSDEELQNMSEKPFDITSSESWGEMGILLIKELGDGVEDILRFMGNIPAGAVLLPRYLSYRLDINSDDPVEATEGEIKIKELVADNPSLGLLDLVGEKGIEMIKQLASMLISGKQGDIAMTLVTIAGLLAGGAGAVKLGARATNMSRVERIAGNVQRGAEKVDDIVGGAGIGHLTGTFKETTTGRDIPEGLRNTSPNLSIGSEVLIPRSDGSQSQGTISEVFENGEVQVEWVENGRTLTKRIDVDKLENVEVQNRITDISKISNFDEVFLYLKSLDQGGIYGSDGQKFYTSVELQSIINDVRAGNLPLSYITSSQGLRQKVAELIQGENNSVRNIREQMVQRLWPDGINNHMSQGQIGNCYFIAVLRSIKNHPQAQKILTRMITIEENGSATVRFPGDIHQRSINITPNQLREIDQRGGVQGSLGDRILERAYARLVDKQKKGLSDGDYSGQTIISGITPNSKMAFEGGHMFQSFKEMFGSYGNDITIGQRNIAEAFRRITHENKDSRIISLGSLPKRTNGERADSYTYRGVDVYGKEIQIYHGHAYGVEDVDIQNARVLIVNPHDTQGQRFWMSFEQVQSYFSNIEAIQLDMDSLMDGLQSSENNGNESFLRQAA